MGLPSTHVEVLESKRCQTGLTGDPGKPYPRGKRDTHLDLKCTRTQMLGRLKVKEPYREPNLID